MQWSVYQRFFIGIYLRSHDEMFYQMWMNAWTLPRITAPLMNNVSTRSEVFAV